MHLPEATTNKTRTSEDARLGASWPHQHDEQIQLDTTREHLHQRQHLLQQTLLGCGTTDRCAQELFGATYSSAQPSQLFASSPPSKQKMPTALKQSHRAEKKVATSDLSRREDSAASTTKRTGLLPAKPGQRSAFMKQCDLRNIISTNVSRTTRLSDGLSAATQMDRDIQITIAYDCCKRKRVVFPTRNTNLCNDRHPSENSSLVGVTAASTWHNCRSFHSLVASCLLLQLLPPFTNPPLQRIILDIVSIEGAIMMCCDWKQSSPSTSSQFTTAENGLLPESLSSKRLAADGDKTSESPDVLLSLHGLPHSAQ